MSCRILRRDEGGAQLLEYVIATVCIGLVAFLGARLLASGQTGTFARVSECVQTLGHCESPVPAEFDAEDGPLTGQAAGPKGPDRDARSHDVAADWYGGSEGRGPPWTSFFGRFWAPYKYRRVHALLVGPDPEPAELARRAHETLEVLSDVDGTTFAIIVDSMTPAETERLLRGASDSDNEAHASVLRRIKGERTAIAALEMKNRLYWPGPGGPDETGQAATVTERGVGEDPSSVSGARHRNDFALWVRGQGPEPTSASSMVCWESIMFSAYRAGVLPKSWITSTYERAAAGARRQMVENANTPPPPKELGYDVWDKAMRETRVQRAFDAELSSVLGVSSATQMVETLDATSKRSFATGPQPERGDLVFFDGTSHVALSLGTTNSKGEHEIMSLWAYPRDPRGNLRSQFQKTTIEAVHEEMLAWGYPKVTFRHPPW